MKWCGLFQPTSTLLTRKNGNPVIEQDLLSMSIGMYVALSSNTVEGESNSECSCRFFTRPVSSHKSTMAENGHSFSSL